jgi:hypothetical protein
MKVGRFEALFNGEGAKADSAKGRAKSIGV